MTAASIRYNNPGAMWGRVGKRTSEDQIVATNFSLAMKWGSTETVYLSDGLKQGNNAAIFPTAVHGAAAQMELWLTRYTGMTFEDATKKWSGGNSDAAYVKFIGQKTGIGAATIITPGLLQSSLGWKLMRAQAQWEAGQVYPLLTDEQWQQAQAMVFRGAKAPTPNAASAPAKPAPRPVAPKPTPGPIPPASGPAPVGFWANLAAALVKAFAKKG